MESQRWFDGLEDNMRKYLIASLYNTFMSIKDKSHKNLSESIESKWVEKLREKEREYTSIVEEKEREYTSMVEELELKNNILSDFKTSTIDKILLSIRDMKDDINTNVREVHDKLTSSNIGKIGEKWIMDVLETNYPTSVTVDNSSYKGGGDIRFTHNGVRFMIESKSQTEDSLRRSPTDTVIRFKKEAIEEKVNDNIDVAIFVAQRANVDSKIRYI